MMGQNCLQLSGILQYGKRGRAFASPRTTRAITDPAGRLSEAPSKDGTATVAEEEACWRRRGLRHCPAPACRGLRLLGESRRGKDLIAMPGSGQYCLSGPFHARELCESMSAGADSTRGAQRYCPAQTSILVSDVGLPATLQIRSPMLHGPCRVFTCLCHDPRSLGAGSGLGRGITSFHHSIY